MALGMEVGLGPVHIVLDGDTVPLPNFRRIFIVAKRLDASRHGWGGCILFFWG